MDNERLQRILAAKKRAAMVGWYDPSVLARSAVLVTIANLFGRHSDTRLIEALATQAQGTFDYSKATGDLWLDYAADLGDGWNSTYAIANAIAREALVLASPDGGVERTEAGRVLVFGGDEVYPYPSREAYELRTEKPYATALGGRARRPDVFAIPGNHDWYDSLIAFSRAFCRPERGFAGCRTHQSRSYFALKLPHRWWWLGIDLQLGADLDEPQVQYFQRVAEALEDDARIVLCVPEPQWILERKHPEDASYHDDAPLAFLENKVLRRRIDVFVAGDSHCYHRHENAEGVQKIVSGGGGAFLHPTHVHETRTLAGGFEERATYPPRAVSRRLAWRNAAFPVRNPSFMWLPAVLYTLSAWFASASLTPGNIGDISMALGASVTAAVRDPVDGLWILALVAIFVFFTDTHAVWYRVLGGVTHALTHLGVAFSIGWLALRFTTGALGLPFGTILQLLAGGAITFVIGGIAGAFVMGFYLLLSVQVFGRHAEQAFSSLRLEDYKQWLRFRIDPAGALTIFAIGIERVPRRWRNVLRDGVASTEPDDARATAPHLIEKIVLPARK